VKDSSKLEAKRTNPIMKRKPMKNKLYKAVSFELKKGDNSLLLKVISEWI